MNDYEIILSKFVSSTFMLSSFSNQNKYIVQLGGNDDQIYFISKENNETVAIIWTILLNADGSTNNYDETIKEWENYNLKAPCMPFFSYQIEWNESTALDMIIQKFKEFDCSAFLLDDKMKKFTSLIQHN